MDKKIIKFEDTDTEEYKHKIPTLKNDEIVVCNKFPLGILLNILFVTKILNKLDVHAYSVHKMIIYKNDLDENRRIYFLIKEEKVLSSTRKFYEKLAISSKSNLIIKNI